MKRVILVALVMIVAALAVTGFISPAHASGPWYDGCITKYYGQGEGATQEHGNDVSCFGYGTAITALLSGTVTYAGWTSFGYYEVTWRLDNPAAAEYSPYAYVEDMSSETVWSGEHVSVGQVLGYSESWVEFGLTPDWAYGISNWRWGANSYFLIQEARNGYTAPTLIYNSSHPTDSGGTYRVQSGDCLSAIAARYGISWQNLYIENRSVIGGNPNLIYPGQVLNV